MAFESDTKMVCMATAKQLDEYLRASEYGKNAAAFSCYFKPDSLPPACATCGRTITQHPSDTGISAAAAHSPFEAMAAVATAGVVTGVTAAATEPTSAARTLEMPLCSNLMSHSGNVYSVHCDEHPHYDRIDTLKWVNIIGWSFMLPLGAPAMLICGILVFTGPLRYIGAMGGGLMILFGLLLTALAIATHIPCCCWNKPKRGMKVSFNTSSQQCTFEGSFDFHTSDHPDPRACRIADLGRVVSLPADGRGGNCWCVAVELRDGTTEILDGVPREAVEARMAQWRTFIEQLQGQQSARQYDEGVAMV